MEKVPPQYATSTKSHPTTLEAPEFGQKRQLSSATQVRECKVGWLTLNVAENHAQLSQPSQFSQPLEHAELGKSLGDAHFLTSYCDGLNQLIGCSSPKVFKNLAVSTLSGSVRQIGTISLQYACVNQAQQSLGDGYASANL